MKAGRTIALPRPARAHRANRVRVTITMHPSELAKLQARADENSMSLTAYVGALLDSDREDVPALANRKRSLWDELTRGPQEPLLVAGRRNKAVERHVAGAHAAGALLPGDHGPACSCATCMAQALGSHDEQKGG